MNLGSRWLAVPGFICIAALATMLSAYSGASSSEGNSPVQPVAFRHTIHVDTLKMNCLYCHFSANKSFDPGLPAVGTCMGCHTIVAGTSDGNKAEIAKLALMPQDSPTRFKGTPGVGKRVAWTDPLSLSDYEAHGGLAGLRDYFDSFWSDALESFKRAVEQEEGRKK